MMRKETRFTFLPQKTTKPDNIYKTQNRTDTEQVMQDSDRCDKGEKKQVSPTSTTLTASTLSSLLHGEGDLTRSPMVVLSSGHRGQSSKTPMWPECAGQSTRKEGAAQKEQMSKLWK